MTGSLTVPEGSASRDRALLARAVLLGRRGWGRVHPNPLVGCVIVQGGEVVGEGWHAQYGGPHAEVVALGVAGDRARGGEVFVSLEPCRHHGQTPPCTDALVAAGVSRVVFGAMDPGRTSGGGAADLRRAGIEVIGPLSTEGEARWENPFFLHEEENRPWTALKLACSLDGFIAERDGVRTVLSGAEATREAHDLRAGFDGILVGVKTAMADDPRLTVRGGIEPRVPPRRIVLDAGGRVRSDARIFSEVGGEVRIVTSVGASEAWKDTMKERGAKLIELSETAEGRIDLVQMMRSLRAEGIRSVLCEGGGRLGSDLVASGLVDRLYLIVAPRFLGKGGVPAFSLPSSGGDGVRGPSWAHWVPGEAPRMLGRDVWVALKPEAS